MNPDAFTLIRPEARTTCVVFASPHSGREYSEALMSRVLLDRHQIRSSEDAHVDRLFAAAPDHGAPLIAAKTPRAFLDLNRGPDELDPALIEGVRRRAGNPRIASGLGVVPRVVANGRQIYRGKISLEEAHRRITTRWRPYHDQLQTLLDESRNRFGQAILIDCHSMPHEALESVGVANGVRPQIVLGDRYGSTAAPAIVEEVEAAFADAGLRVARNMPFAGAFITQQYGQPHRRQHALQVEIDRALYMNEATLELSPDFEDFRALLDRVIGRIAAFGREGSGAMAAE